MRLLATAVTAVLGLACSSDGRTPVAGGGSATPASTVSAPAPSGVSPRPTPSRGAAPTGSGTAIAPGSVQGTVGTSAQKPSGAVLDGSPVTGSAKDLVLVGTVDTNRMIGLSGADLRAGRKPAVRWVSPVFGAVIEAATDGEHVWALSTNTPDLVRLSLKSTAMTSKNIPSQVGAVSRPNFGSLFLDGGLLYLSFDAGSQVTVAVVDPVTLRVVRHKTFLDRFTAYPHMCRVDADHLAVASTKQVDILDARTLARTGTAPLEMANGLACGDGKAYAARYGTPEGVILDAQARTVGSFSWQGMGSAALLFDAKRHVLYGTDDVGSAVFRCPATGGRCRAETLPDKPTSLLVSGDSLLVTIEGAKAVAVLDAATVTVRKPWGIGGIPRTLVAT